MNSGASRQSMSTRFSGSTPISRSAFPVRFTSSWTCPYVSVRPSYWNAGVAPRPSVTLRSTNHDATLNCAGSDSDAIMSGQADVFEIDRLAVDASRGRRDPAGEAAALGHRPHQALDVRLIRLGGQPRVLVRVPCGFAEHKAVRRHLDLGEQADRAAETPVRQPELEVDLVLLDDLVPPVDPALTIGDVVVAQPLVERGQGRRLAGRDAIAGELAHRVGGILEPVVVLLLRFLEAPLEAHGVEVGGVGRDLGPEQVERHRVVEVDVPLDRLEVDPAQPPDVVGLALAHELARALHHPADSGLAHEEMMRLLREHEAAGARQGVEAALGEARQLILAVAIGEVCEHQIRQPVRCLLVEGAEDARLVAVARAALQERLGLLAAVPAEVGIEQVDHRPEVAALLDVDLEQVAQVVERGTGGAEVALLLDRGGLGIALGDDEPAQDAAVLAGDVLPAGCAEVIAEPDRAPGFRFGEEQAPAVLRHPHVVELGPTLRVDAHGGAQVDVSLLEAVGPHAHPPVDELRLPLLERALEPAIVAEAHVVRDALAVVDAGHHTLLRSNSLRRPVPYTSSAPLGPTAFARWKIQFCHAERRPNILLSMVSGPPNRIDASMPVSASGEKAARSSSAMRTSSSQSMSSGVNVTSPAAAAAAASRSSPIRARSLSTRAGSARKRLARRVSPLTMGYAPKLSSVSLIVAGGSLPSGREPSSM